MRWIQLSLLLAATVVSAGEGQGPVDSGPIVLNDSNLGTYWYGAKIDKRDLAGKVVLFEIWGL